MTVLYVCRPQNGKTFWQPELLPRPNAGLSVTCRSFSAGSIDHLQQQAQAREGSVRSAQKVPQGRLAPSISWMPGPRLFQQPHKSYQRGLDKFWVKAVAVGWTSDQNGGLNIGTIDRAQGH